MLTPTRLRRRERLVECHDLAGIRLDEPFLHRTLQRLDTEPVTRPLEEYLAEAEGSGEAPDAIIFHVGRCGSSLLVNMLNAGGARVVSESQYVNAAIRDVLAAHGIDERRRALRALRTGIEISCTKVNAEPISILKTTTWNLAAAVQLRSLYPKAAMLFLTRDVHDVVRSNLRTPPGWSGMRERPRADVLELFPTLSYGPEEPSEAGFYALTWLAGREQAWTLGDAGMCTIEYTSLASDPAATLDRVLEHLRWDLPVAQRDEMIAVTRWNAKDRSRTFDASRDQPPSLSDEDARVVDAVAWLDARRVTFEQRCREHVLPAIAARGFDEIQISRTQAGFPERAILFHGDPQRVKIPTHLPPGESPMCIDLWFKLRGPTNELVVDLQGEDLGDWLRDHGRSDLADQLTNVEQVEPALDAAIEGVNLLLDSLEL